MKRPCAQRWHMRIVGLALNLKTVWIPPAPTPHVVAKWSSKHTFGELLCIAKKVKYTLVFRPSKIFIYCELGASYRMITREVLTKHSNKLAIGNRNILPVLQPLNLWLWNPLLAGLVDYMSYISRWRLSIQFVGPSFNIEYSHHWRGLWLIIAIVVFNVNSHHLFFSFDWTDG